MPTTYPSCKQFINVAKEVTAGTPVETPTTTCPVTSFKPKDDPVWLEDNSLVGSMTKLRGLVQGPRKGSWTCEGPVFLDWIAIFLLNIMGAVATTGPVSSIYTHVLSLLNSGTGQPPTDTIVDWQGLTATTHARTYPGAVVSELTIKGNAESTLLEWSAKGAGWWSTDAAGEPVSSLPTESPLAAWRAELGFGGALPGSKNATIRDYEITITREISVQHTAQNSQDPFIIQRGELSVAGKFFVSKPADETFLDYFRDNTQPSFVFAISNGLAGAAARTMTINITQCACTMTEVNRGDAAVGYDVTFRSVANTTDAGASGGISPIKITITNPVASY